MATTELEHHPMAELAAKLAGLSSTRGYLTWLADAQKDCGASPAQWMLDHGMDFAWSPMPRHLRWGQPRMCYWNSFCLARRRPRRYVYVEGYATSIIPTEHAWCYDRETGLIVDPTWHDGQDYIGVPIKLDYLKKVMLDPEYDSMGIVKCPIHDWQGGYPIQQGWVPVEEWREEL